jgi:hypothetical protein
MDARGRGLAAGVGILLMVQQGSDQQAVDAADGHVILPGLVARHAADRPLRMFRSGQ